MSGGDFAIAAFVYAVVALIFGFAAAADERGGVLSVSMAVLWPATAALAVWSARGEGL